MAANQWFANKGQIVQTLLTGLGCVFAAIKAWPEMKSNEFLSLGALLFYALVGLTILSVAVLVKRLRHQEAGDLVIHSALYGKTGCYTDVTDIVRAHVKDGGWI